MNQSGDLESVVVWFGSINFFLKFVVVQMFVCVSMTTCSSSEGYSLCVFVCRCAVEVVRSVRLPSLYSLLCGSEWEGLAHRSGLSAGGGGACSRHGLSAERSRGAAFSSQGVCLAPLTWWDALHLLLLLLRDGVTCRRVDASNFFHSCLLLPW